MRFGLKMIRIRGDFPIPPYMTCPAQAASLNRGRLIQTDPLPKSHVYGCGSDLNRPVADRSPINHACGAVPSRTNLTICTPRRLSKTSPAAALGRFVRRARPAAADHTAAGASAAIDARAAPVCSPRSGRPRRLDLVAAVTAPCLNSNRDWTFSSRQRCERDNP
jgi:hypothetical protein